MSRLSLPRAARSGSAVVAFTAKDVRIKASFLHNIVSETARFAASETFLFSLYRHPKIPAVRQRFGTPMLERVTPFVKVPLPNCSNYAIN